MKPAPFAYHDPTLIGEAVAILARFENARPLAGGQSLVPMMNFRYAAPDHLVDLNGIAALRGVDKKENLIVDAVIVPQDGEKVTVYDLAQAAADVVDFVRSVDKQAAEGTIDQATAKARTFYATYSFERQGKKLTAYAESRAAEKVAKDKAKEDKAKGGDAKPAAPAAPAADAEEGGGHKGKAKKGKHKKGH